MTSRSGTDPKYSQPARCAATHEVWSIVSTGRTNMCREQASTTTKAHTRRIRLASGSSHRPR
jgi:hypothetical protein